MRSGLCLSGFLFFIFAGNLPAENTLYTDNSFPYRVVCQPEWQETEKNDSVFVIEKGERGSKVCLKLIRYHIDSSFNLENREWSRMQFSINKHWADNFGRLWYVDSGMTISVGSLPAYEVFSYFYQTIDSQVVWWAEYNRWIENNGAGYLVSLFGDTAEVVENFSSYKAMVDSVRLTVSAMVREFPGGRVRYSLVRETPGIFYDLLGRAGIETLKHIPPGIMVGKKIKRCRVH
ncbi:MAG: hypothetical protein JW913_16280 [Chitinispirillaceae bacterium]|nr:hypothetical protein [Chitinispirillaceae bacterium]